MNTLNTLFAPLKYLRARNRHKLVWDWIIPSLLATGGVLCLLLLPKPIAILGEHGLVYWVNELLQVLIGFYIAALAAIASFDRDALDQKIEGDGVFLLDSSDDGEERTFLTRRAFLSLMFGYLSLLSIVLYCVGLAASLLHSNIQLIDSDVIPWLRGIFLFAYGLFFAQMLTITLVALFYLADRIHRRTPTALPPEDVNPN